jgi:hypothetical protein
MLPRCAVLVLAFVLPSHAHAQQSGAPKAREVIEAAIAAKGGAERLRRFPAWHIEYRETFLRDGRESVETGDAYEHLARDQARYETAPDDFIVVNGTQGWVKRGKQVTVLTAGQLADFREYFRGKEAMLTLLPLQTEEWQSAVIGDKEVDGRMSVMLRITRKRWIATLYLDKQTHLLAAAEYPHKRLIEVDDSKRASIREARFRDYQAFDGIQFHTKLLSFSKGKPLGQVKLTGIKLMKQLPDSVLIAPQ